jgi:hypothetical protein
VEAATTEVGSHSPSRLADTKWGEYEERREKIAYTGSGGLDTPGAKAGDGPTSQSCRGRGKHPSTPKHPQAQPAPNSHSCGSSHETFGELVMLLAQGLLTVLYHLLSHLATFRQGSSQNPLSHEIIGRSDFHSVFVKSEREERGPPRGPLFRYRFVSCAYLLVKSQDCGPCGVFNSATSSLGRFSLSQE